MAAAYRRTRPAGTRTIRKRPLASVRADSVVPRTATDALPSGLRDEVVYVARPSVRSGGLAERVLTDEELVRTNPSACIGAPDNEPSDDNRSAPCTGVLTRGVTTVLRPRDRDPEVGDPHAALVIDEHVGRLEVAMEDALRVRHREPCAELMAV
jgi:hypothetical protein